MANPEHLRILKFGSSVWNRWRAENPHVVPDLSRAHLREGRLSSANLVGADLTLAYLGRADLSGADLSGAILSEASFKRGYFAKAKLENAKLVGTDLTRADFYGARLVGADLSQAYLEGANLTGADLERATLTDCDLRLAVAVDTNFRGADLTGSQVYGISAWNTVLEGAEQRDLIITRPDENVVTTDSLHVAQFVYLLLSNRTIRDVIETVGKKAILILGRFSPARKTILESMRQELRRSGLVPILFDFEGPGNRDMTETVSILAHLARAVIADLTDARSVPQELMAVVPNLPSVPLFPIIASSAVEYSMFEHLRKYPWVHPTFSYASQDDLLHWLRTSLRPFAQL